MRLLFILPEYLPQSGGGIITFYRAWLPCLVALGHEVRVIVGSASTMSDDARPSLIDGVSVEMLSRARFEAQLPAFSHYAAVPGLQAYLAAAWALFEQAERGAGFAAVETTDWGLLFVPWVVERPLPVVLQMHGSCGQIGIHDPVAGEELQGHLIRLIEKVGTAHADVVQSYSVRNAEFWQAQSGRSVDVIPPAYRAGPVPSAEPRSGRGLVVGRIQRWKGPQVLCEAMRLLGEQAPSIDWMGRDTAYDTRARTTDQVLAQQFPDVWRSKLTPIAPQPADIARARQQSAAFVVVPSTWDVFNFTCVEAMAVGTPVVCSRGAGASQWIEDGVNGFSFDSSSAPSLVAALRRLMALDQQERETLGQRARETVVDALDPERIAGRRLQGFEMVAASRSTLPAADWLRNAAAPARERLDGRRLLDHLPLRGLSRYVLRRAVQKVLGS